MKKRFIYSNVSLPKSQIEIVMKAALITASCGSGKISVHLADGIALERKNESDTAIFSVGDTSYALIIVKSFENMIQKNNCPAIYVLETEEKGWKESWRRNRQRLKKSNISLVGIKDLPISKQEEKRHEYRKKVPIPRKYISDQHQKHGNMFESNEFSIASPETIKSNSKKTVADNVHTNKKRKCNGICVKTLIFSFISVGTAFYAHGGIIIPYPFFGEWFIDCAISLSSLCFTWCVLYIAYIIATETIIAIIKPTIDKKFKTEMDKEIIVVKISETLASLLVLLIAPICVFFSI